MAYFQNVTDLGKTDRTCRADLGTPHRCSQGTCRSPFFGVAGNWPPPSQVGGNPGAAGDSASGGNGSPSSEVGANLHCAVRENPTLGAVGNPVVGVGRNPSAGVGQEPSAVVERSLLVEAGENPSLGPDKSSLLDAGLNVPFPAEQSLRRASSCEHPGCSFGQKQHHTGHICRASLLCAVSGGPSSCRPQ